MKPTQRCPVCGREAEQYSSTKRWFCNHDDQGGAILGKLYDPDGAKWNAMCAEIQARAVAIHEADISVRHAEDDIHSLEAEILECGPCPNDAKSRLRLKIALAAALAARAALDQIREDAT